VDFGWCLEPPCIEQISARTVLQRYSYAGVLECDKEHHAEEDTEQTEEDTEQKRGLAHSLALCRSTHQTLASAHHSQSQMPSFHHGMTE